MRQFRSGWRRRTRQLDLLLEGGQQYLIATGSRAARARAAGWRELALAHLGRYEEATLESETVREHSRSTREIVYLPLGTHAWSMADLLDSGAIPGTAEEWLQTAPIYNWFTEGVDTGDLKEARALLEERA